MKPMDKYDIPLLYSAKFLPGWSGASWFGRDSEGNVWQAWLDEKSFLVFRSETQGKWGETLTLYVDTFRSKFNLDSGEEDNV